MSCYLLIRNIETDEAIGLTICEYGSDGVCIEDFITLQNDPRFGRIETEVIEKTEYETYKALNLFKEYTRETLNELVLGE